MGEIEEDRATQAASALSEGINAIHALIRRIDSEDTSTAIVDVKTLDALQALETVLADLASGRLVGAGHPGVVEAVRLSVASLRESLTPLRQRGHIREIAQITLEAIDRGLKVPPP